MARLFTTGFEMGTVSLFAEGFTTQAVSSATLTMDASTVRSGARSMKVVCAGSGNYWLYTYTATQSRRYYCRAAVNIALLPGAGGTAMLTGLWDGSNRGMYTQVDQNGVLRLLNNNNDALLATGPTLATNTWYVIEHSWVGTSGASELRVDGVSYGGTAADASGSTSYSFSVGSNAAQLTAFWDDVALNDDQAGAGQNSWCGLGKVVMLRPTADSSRTGFTTGAAGTTALWDCVNNFPPVGVVQTSSTSTSQIKDATSSTTDNYVASLPAYTTAVASGGGGIGASDSVLLVQGVAVHGYNTTTSQSNGIKVTTNPAVGEVTGSSGTTLAATYPTGWTTLRTAYAYLPVVTRTTAVTMTFRKNTATVNYSMCCFIGLLFEYVPVSRLSLMGVG